LSSCGCHGFQQSFPHKNFCLLLLKRISIYCPVESQRKKPRPVFSLLTKPLQEAPPLNFDQEATPQAVVWQQQATPTATAPRRQVTATTTSLIVRSLLH
jgi:hypothetical protein